MTVETGHTRFHYDLYLSMISIKHRAMGLFIRDLTGKSTNYQ